jgi:hypothetical protein
MSGEFDVKESSKRRERGIEQAEKGANPDWMRAAAEAVASVAREHETFTTDHVWAWLAAHAKDVSTPEKRAMGAVMRDAVQMNLCVRVEGRFVRSSRTACHRRPLQVYRSLTHKAQIQN